MNPPNSDGKGPGTPSGASGPGPDAAEPDAIKPDAVKADPTAASPDPTRSDAVKSASQPLKADGPKPAVSPVPPAPKPAETKAVDAKSEPAKVEPAKTDPAKPETGTVEPAKPAASTFGSGAASGPKPDLIKSEPSKAEALKSEPPKSAGPTSTASSAAGSGPSSTRADPPKPGGLGGNPQSSPQKSAITDGPIIDLKAKRLPEPADAAKAAAASSATKPSGSSTFTTGSDKTASGSDAKPTGSATSNSSTTPKIGPSGAANDDGVRRGAGFGSVAAAGLLGGVLGAGLLFAVERWGALGGDDDARLAALDQKIAALAPKDALTALDKRIGANEAALKPLPDAIRSANATAKDALQKAGAAPASAPADGSAPAAAPLPTDLIARLDGLDQRVAALQEEPGRDQSGNAALAALGPQALSGFEERLKAVEGKVEGAAKPDAPNPLADQVAALKGDVDTRTKANAEADEALSQRLASLQQSLEARVKAATEAVQAATQASQQAVDANKTQAVESAKGVERQLQAQSEKIAGLDQAVASRADVGTVQAGLRIIAADRIATALNTGLPYADALAALRATDPGNPAKLTAVAPFADKGAPTAQSLAAEFRPIVERIDAARRAAQAKTVAETGDIKQRLMSMAESIIQVRKVDAPAAPGGHATEDAAPKVQDALDRGAIAEAAKAFAALPEDVRARAGEFGTKLASRAAAGEAAQGLLADAFKALPSTGAAR